MKNTALLAILLAIPLFITGCGNDMPEDQAIDYEQDVKPLIEEIDEKYRIRGSCNAIADKSSCVDFVGSIFTEERMRLSCESVGTFSKNTCPYSELGGCQATPGTLSESIVWSYDYGGQPISKEEAVYQAMACNSLPMGKWVMPDDLFLKKE